MTYVLRYELPDLAKQVQVSRQERNMLRFGFLRRWNYFSLVLQIQDQRVLI